ncbi:glycosyltransferase family 39 protein [Streptomyces sp. MNP-20]|uniref:glycosyltransferase family 39 protein n=1 Tax=Streptomyces sp. MNP-20 TaxID=2721165 RepID=UPI0028160485|nr:glycosyltransferase family 39 protein [Streptomyces sp. MNP-20]
MFLEPAIAAVETSSHASRRAPTTALPLTPRRRWRQAWAVAVPGALLSLALGLWGVRRDGTLWRDEAVTYDMARRGLPDLWHTLGNADAVHGLYYLLMRGLFALCGDADPLLVLRLPSVAATALAAAGVACLGRRLVGPRAGLLAGVAFAPLPLVQWHAQEGRSYAMVLAVVVWATYALVRAVETRRPGRWALYGALMLTACVLHEFAALALAAHAVALPRTARRPWSVTATAVALGLTPLALLSHRQSAQVDWIGGPNWSAVLQVLGLWVLGLMAVVVLTGRPRPARAARVTISLPALGLSLLVLPPLALWLASLVKPLYVDRYVLYGQAGLALLLGAALDRFTREGRRRALGAAAALTAATALVPVSLGLRTPASRVDDTTAAARALRDIGAPGDAVLYLPLRRRVWSLPYPWAARGLHDIALARSPAASHTLYGTEVAPGVLRARLSAESRVVVVTDPAGQPADTAPGEAVKRYVLERYFEACATRRAHGIRIVLYAHPGLC